MKKITLLTISLLFAAVTGLDAQVKEKPNLLQKIEESGEFEPMFPFQPIHAVPSNITNVKTWPGVDAREAGADGFITVEGDHFIDGTGKERRFLGTNICFTGCFPEHEDADKVAAELARYGINIVRLHYVHHKFPADKKYPEPDSFLEPEQLERFDYFFSKLKENGIYTYFQLNIARKFGAQNGFPNADKLPWYNNGIDNVDKKMIELQKKYHKEILEHVNPYTKLPYKDEPAISMLELSNENSIIHAWFGNKYDFANLTEPYASEMKKMWNEWLIGKYKNTKNLKAAWLPEGNGSKTELMPDGIIVGNQTSNKLWVLQNDKISKGTWSVQPADPKDKLKGKYFARVDVVKNGSAVTIPQFCRSSVKLRNGATYCLTLKLRANKETPVSIRFSQAHDPWGVAGLSTKVTATSKWQSFTFNFASNMDDDNVRLCFSHLTPGTMVDIADVSLVEGISFKWPEKMSLEKKNMDWPHPSEWSFPQQRAEDFVAFLGGLEAKYFEELYSHIKTEVKPHQPVAGTQLLYGRFLPEAKMDYCDNHSYWNHPIFLKGAWDRSNWLLMSRSLANGEGAPGSNLSNLARARVLGKPLTISEYDHPCLNFYSAEGDIMVSAMGAFQNWSGIMQFAWTHSTDYFRDVMSQMFDLCSATQKLVHFPACWAMFVRGDVSKGDDSSVAVWNSSTEKDTRSIAKKQTPHSLAAESNPVMRDIPLAMRAGTRIEELPELYPESGHKFITSPSQVPAEYRKAYSAREVVSSTGELTWNWQVKGAGYFKVDTRNTKAFTGFVKGRTFDFKGMSLTPGKTRLDWLTMSMTLTNPGPDDSDGTILKPGTYLLALTGLCHNTDAVVVDMGNGRISSATKLGGNPGVSPVLCEGIQARLALDKLAGKVKCYALNAMGMRARKVEVLDNPAGDAILMLSPAYKTVWYEVVIGE